MIPKLKSSQADFDRLASQGYTHAPLVHTLLADFETPLSVYYKLANQPFSYLLESVQGGDKWGRYSVIGLPCATHLRVSGEKIELIEKGELIESYTDKNPLDWLVEYQQRFKVLETPGLPKFNGGLVGYFGYDTVRFIEPDLVASMPARDEVNAPDILLLVSRELVVFDNLSGQVHVMIQQDLREKDSFAKAENRLAEILADLAQPFEKPITRPGLVELDEEDFVSSFGEQEFKAAVEQTVEYLKSGEALQVVLSQQMSAEFTQQPIDLYRSLRYLNPSPYMFYLNLDDFFVVGSSPEILIRLEDEVVTVRPIAGTRRRGLTQEQDLALEKDLLADPKEVIEHEMLIDLGIFDLEKVSIKGSVELTERMVVERYSHVMHIVSNLDGKLQPGLVPMDVLKATFPAGTVSGAEKLRAMQMIDEFEPVKRGVYAGAVGYIGWHNNMDLAIAIRTAVIKNNRLFVQAGAGIVKESNPQNEWDETLNKGRAIFKAAQFVTKGMKTNN